MRIRSGMRVDARIASKTAGKWSARAGKLKTTREGVSEAEDAI